MKWVFGWTDSSVNHSDVNLHVFAPNKNFSSVAEVCWRKLISFTPNSVFVLYWICKTAKRTRTIMAEDQQIELKFRIYDGTDIGHRTYAPSLTVATLKQRLVSEWPQDKIVMPKSVNDVKLIHGGKVLENSKTLVDSVIPFGELPGGVITMHVVVQHPVPKRKSDKNHEKKKQNSCSCNIL